MSEAEEAESGQGEQHRLRQRRAGVYEVTTQSGVLPQVLAEWGWRVGVLRADELEDRSSLLLAIGRALDCGEHFDATFDALADCLSDLARPTVLVLDSWPRPSEVPGWDQVLSVLNERVRNEQAAPFALVMDLSG